MRFLNRLMPLLEMLPDSFAASAEPESEKAAFRTCIDRILGDIPPGTPENSAFHRALLAVVVLIDEKAALAQWEGAASWHLSSLQHRYFGTTDGGVRFYEYMEAARTSQTEEGRLEFEVFFACLCLGFQGIHYGIEGNAVRSAMIDASRHEFCALNPDLARAVPEAEFAHFDEQRISRRRNYIPLVAAGCLIAGIVAFSAARVRFGIMTDTLLSVI